MGLFSKDVGIDLGTANTLVYMKGKGIIMREPSVVAVDTKTDEVRCVGAEAKAVIGRTPGSIVAVRPLKDGVIADFDITTNMLENFLKKACGNSMFSRPRVVICIPSGVTEVERRAVREATLKAGARQVSVIEEPMAAAIGAGLPISEPVRCWIMWMSCMTCWTPTAATCNTGKAHTCGKRLFCAASALISAANNVSCADGRAVRAFLMASTRNRRVLP